LLNLDEEKIIARLSSRIFCKNCNQSYNLITKPTKVYGKCDVCGHTHFYSRDDDKQDAIKVRLASYERQTKPLIEYYREYKNYIEINAAQTIEDIQDRIGSFIKDN
jgi:adenylate kinase